MKRGARILAWLVAAAAAVGAVVWALSPRRPPRSSGPMPHEAYVWQRAWTEEVRSAVAGADERLSRLVVLAAEISFRGKRANVVRAAIDYEALAGSNRPVGLALRIGAFPGPFAEDEATTELVTNVAATILSDARTGGLTAEELQIDFDCAESKLAGYRVWVQAVRRRISPTPVIVTALPCWLKRPAMRDLVGSADGFVLQVHSLQKPPSGEGRLSLCDPVAAREAVEAAARLGKPFRVALPTYGYVAAFDASGRLLGISAEGPARSWPAQARLRLVGSNPAEMAELVRAWGQDRPANLKGILWYRLPVASDRLNWPAATLAEVLAGRTPEPRLIAEVRYPSPGLAEVDLTNAGTADAPADVTVSVRWSEARAVASDGLGGFRRLDVEATELRLQGPADPLGPPLAPGERRTICWVRLNRERKVEAYVQR